MNTLMVASADAPHRARTPADRSSAHCVLPTQEPVAPKSRRSERPPAAVSAPVRVFLVRYVQTLGVMLGAAVSLVVGWSLASTTPWVQGHPWPAACLATTG